MNEILGKDVMLEVYSSVVSDYIPYICAQDVTIRIEQELVNKTTLSSGRFNEYAARLLDWSVELSGISSIIGSGRTIFNTVKPENLITKQDIRLRFVDSNDYDAVFTGSVYVKSVSISGDQDNFSGFEQTMQGTGAFVLEVTSSIILLFADDETDSGAGVEAIVAAEDDTIQFEFYSKLSTGTPCRMDIYVSSVQQIAVNFQSSYLGSAFWFTDLAGVVHEGTFTNGDVNF